MPTADKPLFRSEALRPRLSAFTLSPALAAARTKLGFWAKLLATKQADALKETELLGDFLADVFVQLLGYTGPAAGAERYTLKREATVEVDGKFADAALGRFSTADGRAEFVAAVEGKGPRDPLDRPFAGRRFSAVDQALRYAVNLPCDWYLVTNLRELRLYHKGHDQFTCERFETAALAADEAVLRKFVFLLGAERLLPAVGRCHLDDLLAESQRIGLELTRAYYREYAALRRHTFEQLRAHNPDERPPDLLAATQKILDRILFIAFAEDRGLLPSEAIAHAYRHADPYNPRPIWDNFRGLFRAVNEGSPHLHIERYNGGLFAPDALLERLRVPDDVCQGFDQLAAYEYRAPSPADDAAPDSAAKLIDVEILGHIFEQSISDLEELHQEIASHTEPRASASGPAKAAPSRRKKEGAFYTPAFVTRYIVAETLKPLLAERFEALRRQHHQQAAATVRKVLDQPNAFDASDLKPAQKTALVKFWEAWQDTLATVRLVDPACGSGAFLIEAFEQLYAVYQQSIGHLTELRGPFLFEIDRQILQANLFGVDLNEEAVDICRLSLWIKTAQLGKVLTSLDNNIKVGNSVVADASVHPRALDWPTAFPDVFAAGGFDVVIGNPPYVRQEWIKQYKPYLEQRFPGVYSGTADLYVYFYGLGYELLRPGGKLAFISSNSFARAGFAEPLRRFLTTRCRLEQFIDLGDTQTFSDAKDVYPAIVVFSKPRADATPQDSKVRSVRFRREDRGEKIGELLESSVIEVSSASLDPEGWRFEPKEVVALRKKLTNSGNTLGQYVAGRIYLGLKTGLNEAFIIETAYAEHLIEKDARYLEIIKPFVGGQDLRRWYQEDSGTWLIVMPNGTTRARCGSDEESTAWQWLGETFPAVAHHLASFEKAARKRGDKGQFWWELRPCDYYGAFDGPKIMYPDITKSARFSMDTAGLYSANTTYILPVKDYYLLGVLNSDALWFALAGISIPFGERAGEFRYRLFTQYVERLPIPDAGTADRGAIAALALRCSTLGAQRHQLEEAVRRRLTTTFGINDKGQALGKLNEKAQNWWQQGLPELGPALKTSFKLSRNPFTNPKTADEWEPYLAEKRREVETLGKQLNEAEAEINDRVYRLFQLGDEEVKLLQREVEH